MAALERFRPVYLGILHARNASRAMAGGYDGAASYVAARDQVDKSTNALIAHLKETGDPLNLLPHVNALQSDWQPVLGSSNGMGSDGRSLFGKVTESATALLNDIGDNSNLTLDPDVDSFYLINAMVLTLPNTLEDLSQQWGWGTYALALSQQKQRELSTAEMRRYVVWAAGAGKELSAIERYLARAYSANPAVKSQLDLQSLADAQAFQAYAADLDKLLGDSNLTPQAYFAKGKEAIDRLYAFYDKGLPALDKLLARRLDGLQTRLYTVSAVALLCVLVAAYLFYCFFLVTRGGLRLISHHLQDMAEGDLRKAPSQPWGKDEPALVIIDLRRTYDALHQLIRRVRNSARELNITAREIASASTDLSARTEAAAASLEEQAAAMEQIGSTVASNAERAQDASSFSSENSEVADKGGQVIGQVVHTMREIHGSSTRINDIIGVIDGIAFQTNILALNAAVEAARAGDAGRGFAVVAAEVRNLAQRSAEAAREIKALITTSVSQVTNGTQVVENAGSTMGHVVTNAQQINNYLNEIASAAREQTSGVAQVVQAIQALDRDTQQNSALVEQTNAAAESLRQQADMLMEEIAKFRVV